jgi:magnesium-transporting ATPase (P-type)
MFAHIFFLYHPELNQGGILGYQYWSVFFASMMYPVLFFCFGYLLHRLVNTYIQDPAGVRFGKILVSGLYGFSMFYFLISFFPYRNSYNRIGLNPFWYYVIAVASTVLIVLILINLPKQLKAQINELKAKVGKAKTIISGYIEVFLKWEYRTDDPNEFRDDWYKKSREGGLF